MNPGMDIPRACTQAIFGLTQEERASALGVLMEVAVDAAHPSASRARAFLEARGVSFPDHIPQRDRRAA